jgi:hypothetical protein
MPARKPKFEGKQTKWEKRLISKEYARRQRPINSGRIYRPKIQPVTIAAVSERKKALSQGTMIFYHGKKRIELPLINSAGRTLQGAYHVGKNTYVEMYAAPGNAPFANLSIAELEIDSSGTITRTFEHGFFAQSEELGHMLLPEKLKHRGIGLTAVSKTERHMRAEQKGKHQFETVQMFTTLFERLGYKKIDPENFGRIQTVHKEGKHQPKDNLDQYHRIEAIDPKTGKAKLFTFPVKKS